MTSVKRQTVQCRRRSSPRGLTLVEVTVSTLIVGCLVVASLQSVGNMSRTAATTNQVHDGQSLAQDLLREVLAQGYADPADAAVTTWGSESGESNRAAFDDLDDYDDWSESPVTDAAGNALVGYAGWSRTVVVKKLNTWDYSIRSDTSTDTGLRSVTVTAISPGGKTTTLAVYRHSDGGTKQPLSANAETVSWVGCTLKLGENAPSTMSASVSNHAEDQ
jgi:type II secretory pathway pseudopilin PulG